MAGLNVLGGVAAAGILAGMVTGGIAPLFGVPAMAGSLLMPIMWRSTAPKASKRERADADLYVIQAQKTENLELAVLTREVARRMANEDLADRLRVFCDLVDSWTLHAHRLSNSDVARSRHGIRVLQENCRKMSEDEVLMGSQKGQESLDNAIRILSRQLAAQLVRVEPAPEVEA